MRLISIIPIVPVLISSFILSGCMTAQQHYEQTHGAQEKNMTVGLVQKEIKKGMPASDVALALGSPNIVTTDELGREVWVYDKISTDVSYSASSGGGGLSLLIGGITGTTLVGGSAGGNYQKGAGAQSKTQRTLTVIIKYDENKMVRDFAYHSSRF